ncbi:MAG: SEC-C domain-containing protein [Myxococcaceae bacterium]|nr:SEC-C domain-containing protein [Myxococcaceae bacterium]
MGNRNEPCPCGSGVKFKKCCLGKATSHAPAAPSQASNSQVADSMNAMMGFPGLSPYSVAKISEDPRSAGQDRRLRRLIERGIRDGWTIMKVQRLTTQAIEAQLAAYGVAHSRERFLRLAEGRDSAWSISEVWLERDDVTCRGTEVDFLGLAACELWKRYSPERPSVEMIDDWMQEGYSLVEERKGAQACDLWWKVWCTLSPRFLPSMTTMNSTSPVFNGLQSVFNWSQDFENELFNPSLHDQRYATMGSQYCTEWIAQFRDESDLVQLNFRRALSSHLHRLGQSERASELLHELVEKWPENVWGYVALADAYSHFFRSERICPYDPEKAERYLRRALALQTLRDGDRIMLEDRLEQLHEGAAP